MSERRTLALYVGAGAVYIAVGIAFPEFLFAWPVAVAYVLLAVWVVPAFVRRLR